MLKVSPYVLNKKARNREAFHRRLIRGLYSRFLDELYIPSGTRASYTEDNGRKPPRPNQGSIKLLVPHGKNRWGVQEVYFFEEFGYLYRE